MMNKSVREMEVVRSSVVTLFFVVFTLGVYIRSHYLNPSLVLTLDVKSGQKSMLAAVKNNVYNTNISIPSRCPLNYQSKTCQPNHDIVIEDHHQHVWLTVAPPSCPDYFRWIHEDLWPWRETGISSDMVMRARESATFRLVILNGKAYVEKYRETFQTRDVFTAWGILQLLRRYPGKVPDLDLMFGCDDLPVVPPGPAPPPVFRYAGNATTYDIVFPDWSFWGWPENNIKPWEPLLKDLREGNSKARWIDREPYAYWKGTDFVSDARRDLVKCNVSDKQDWNARIYVQDWKQERRRGFKKSKLASQCIHRYKIYIEGVSWSVSLKYILACDSMTLLINPIYYDFFMRSLMPLKHYWPIKEKDKCRSIKHAVDWGNAHQQEAEALGKAGSRFVEEQLKMEYVYDYMFHLLSEYSKLLKYKPSVPKRAIELCSESIACLAKVKLFSQDKQFLIESQVKAPALSQPCTMPPAYTPASFHSLIQTKRDAIKQVDLWEKDYWQSHNFSKQV